MGRTTRSNLRAEADHLRSLHDNSTPLILPNAWDVGSARIMEQAGSRAIATTSGGVAWSHGYPDGDQLPVHLLTQTVAGIARTVSVPVSVDIEGGYSDDPAQVAETIAAMIDAGAVGINIEDGSGTVDLLCDKIDWAKQAGERLGVPLFINVRTDVYLRSLAPGEEVAEVIRRAGQYAAAGMDGLFVPGLADPESIQAIVNAVDQPLNVMTVPGLPSAAELGRLGVRRLSAGTGLTQAVYGRAKDLAEAFLNDGVADPVSTAGMGYPEINALFG